MPAKKRPRGKPRTVFDLEKVTIMAAIGASPYEMASYFDCSTRVIQKRLAEDEDDPIKGDFVRAYKKGFGEVKRGLRRVQIETAMNGNPALLIWLGKNLLDQSDKMESKSEVTQDVKMELTPEMEKKIKAAAQVVMNDREILPHG